MRTHVSIFEPPRGKRALIPPFVLMSVALGACAAPPAVPQAVPAAPQKGGTIVIGIEGDFGAMDPHNPTGAGIGGRVLRNAFEPLIGDDFRHTGPQDRTLFVPELAESWEYSPDKLSITFKLRKGVKFHDGSPFNSDAVLFHYRRLNDADFPYYHKLGAGRNFRPWQQVKDAQVVDEYTVRFNFKQFDPSFLFNQKYRWGGYQSSPEMMKKYSVDEIADHPAGTGPYRIVEIVKGEKVVLEKNKEYRQGEPYIDRIIFRPIPEALARVAALQAGEVDLIVVVPPDSVEPLQKEGRFDLYTTKDMARWLFHFNTRVPPYDDKRVRQAINYAINREALTKDILKGMARPMVSVLSDASPGFDPTGPRYSYDPAKAKALLAEAGLANGFSTTWWIPTSGTGMLFPVPMTEFIARNLKEVGIDVKIVTQEWTSYFAKFRTGLPPEYGAAAMSWASENGPPRDLENIIPAFQPPKGLNVGYYDNRKAQELWDKASVTIDDAQRTQIYKELMALLVEDAGWLFGVSELKPIAAHKKVRDFVNPPLDYDFDLTKVWLAQ